MFYAPNLSRIAIGAILSASMRGPKKSGYLPARMTLVKAESIRPGAKLVGKELLRLEQPLAVDHFEGLAVQQSPRGTMIFIASDDNYSSFQQTLLLQFLLPREKS
jgi:hypothetical protein